MQVPTDAQLMALLLPSAMGKQGTEQDAMLFGSYMQMSHNPNDTLNEVAKLDAGSSANLAQGDGQTNTTSNTNAFRLAQSHVAMMPASLAIKTSVAPELTFVLLSEIERTPERASVQTDLSLPYMTLGKTQPNSADPLAHKLVMTGENSAEQPHTAITLIAAAQAFVPQRLGGDLNADGTEQSLLPVIPASEAAPFIEPHSVADTKVLLAPQTASTIVHSAQTEPPLKAPQLSSPYQQLHSAEVMQEQVEQSSSATSSQVVVMPFYMAQQALGQFSNSLQYDPALAHISAASAGEPVMFEHSASNPLGDMAKGKRSRAILANVQQMVDVGLGFSGVNKLGIEDVNHQTQQQKLTAIKSADSAYLSRNVTVVLKGDGAKLFIRNYVDEEQQVLELIQDMQPFFKRPLEQITFNGKDITKEFSRWK